LSREFKNIFSYSRWNTSKDGRLR